MNINFLCATAILALVAAMALVLGSNQPSVIEKAMFVAMGCGILAAIPFSLFGAAILLKAGGHLPPTLPKAQPQPPAISSQWELVDDPPAPVVVQQPALMAGCQRRQLSPPSPKR